MRILVADDDPISRRMMQKMLQDGGYEVVTAEDGLKAVHELSVEDAPRLALVDWMMPEMDGPGVCREIRGRKDESYVYIILLTSKQSSEDIVAGLQAGADDYLTKPCHSAELKARLLTGRRILQLEDKLVEAREEMRFKATHDSLTSLWNRGAITSLMKSELYRGQRSKKPVSIMLCDVDHFKRVNDLYGHTAGDSVLREVASRLVKSVRPYDAVGRYGDAVGRYGGEEFLLILGDCDAEQVQQRAENVRESIAKEAFQTNARELSVTISIGATTITGWDKTQSIESILNHADTALYRAKSEGRNRVLYAESLVPA
jgi:two-component system, cell cycle response regulator